LIVFSKETDMRHMLKFVFALILALTAAVTQAAGLDAITSGDASAGVKEALAKGADYAVASLGKGNGFLGNDKVKIPLPGYLQTAEKGLRMFGMGRQADELIETMNHAAENAVAEAKPILSDSIKKMSVKDAKGILTGGDDSVTQYFKRTSTEQLTKKFMPIVQASTKKLQLAEQYNSFAGKAASSGLIDKKDADIDSYVTQKAMDGLFLMIAEEEKKLRSNPLGAGSDLLKKVFGAL
jgi:hypothetical protein